MLRVSGQGKMIFRRPRLPRHFALASGGGIYAVRARYGGETGSRNGRKCGQACLSDIFGRHVWQALWQAEQSRACCSPLAKNIHAVWAGGAARPLTGLVHSNRHAHDRAANLWRRNGNSI
ncbi:MAG: hypothetical protein BCS36_03880 [Desulfovibrio sp. MES5]|nr:MAG: hypothetical protein BCS36_03880 [Desulfovibrio sp. MES5]